MRQPAATFLFSMMVTCTTITVQATGQATNIHKVESRVPLVPVPTIGASGGPFLRSGGPGSNVDEYRDPLQVVQKLLELHSNRLAAENIKETYEALAELENTAAPGNVSSVLVSQGRNMYAQD